MPKFLIFHKFCSFWSFGVYGPSSFMVDDYTAERERERERGGEREREGEREWEGEREKCFFPLQKFSKTTQREEVLYEKEKFF